MAVVWIAWVVLMAGVNLPTPLYAVYSQRFGFSSAVLTAVFALYAPVLVPALMLFGQLSDRLGRRVVLLMGLGAGAARIAPGDRRGEVTAAFITCIYVGVAGSVITVGLLDTRVSLAVAVGLVAAVLAALALTAGAWHRYGKG